MPFKESGVMDERCRFVIKALEPGSNKSKLCREFGISRPTGDKWLRRYEREGLDGLKERSRRPLTSSCSTSAEVVCEIVKLRHKRRGWGGKKLRPLLLKKFKSSDVPASRTIDRILARCGLVEPRRPRVPKEYSGSSELVQAEHSNQVWTVDFKGWWYTKDRKRCEPLTIRDEYSRFIIDIVALRYTHTDIVQACFRKCFEKYGLPEYIRSDNGSPFAAPSSLFGLSKLSVWWLSLGIEPNRTRPGRPQGNGAHERMHKDIKKELQSNPAYCLEQEQIRFDEWKTIFNYERAHEALDMLTPSELYKPSSREYYSDEPAYEYPESFEKRHVDAHGKFSWFGKKLFLSKSLAGREVGIEKNTHTEQRLWYANFCLGTYDLDFTTLRDVT